MGPAGTREEGALAVDLPTLGIGQANTVRSSSAALPITAAALAILYNIAFAISCTSLPSDPLHLGTSLSIYAWSGVVLSCMGLFGVAFTYPTPIVSFAHFLLIDTLVSTLSRFLAFEVLVDQYRKQGICAELFEIGAGRRVHCKTALDAAQAFVIALLAVPTVAQGCIAVLIRRYGKELEQRQQHRAIPSACEEEQDPNHEPWHSKEGGFLEIDSDGDRV